MSGRDKWVRRFSVDETSKHKNGFTIYKIQSVLFPLDSPEAVTVISVWKRYSDVQRLHASMRTLHAGLHLRGTFPSLPRFSYFKRFTQEVLEQRGKIIKGLLEFIAEHQLLFTSTEFVNFLQTGYPEPESSAGGVINAIRSSLHLPIEQIPPLEYQTSDDDSRSPAHTARQLPIQNTDETDFISQIPIYEAADVEICDTPASRQSLNQMEQLYHADSFESIASLDSDLYSEVEKVAITKKPTRNVLPDLINFDMPSTSNFRNSENSLNSNRNESDTTSLNSTMYDGRTTIDTASLNSTRDGRKTSDATSLNSTIYDGRISRTSHALSQSNVTCVTECKTKTEDSYVFEAGYLLNLAARYEDMREYHRAFECYKAGIEKMLIGVKTDGDPHRRALIKQKTNKYLSYAENIHRNHLCDVQQSLLVEREEARPLHCPIPLSMLARPYEELSQYRVVAVLGSSLMLVLHRSEQTCYVMKVVQKVPHNLTEFDEYFLQNTNETRTPILPTVIPYMVPLHAYVETNNLIFLILSYAPGEKLFDYIKNYAKSIPNTPAREVNLENVFTEPKTNNFDMENDNCNSITETRTDLETNDKFNDDSKLSLKLDEVDARFNQNNDEITIVDRIEANLENNQSRLQSIDNNQNETKTDDVDMEISVNELVINSQKLLLNVDKALSEPKIIKIEDAVEIESRKDNKTSIREVKTVEMKDDVLHVERRIDTPTPTFRLRVQPRDVIPPSAVCKWGAEILTALESLHNCGVICRDLHGGNVLLGDNGHVTLTYCLSYPAAHVQLARVRGGGGLHVAPELHAPVHDARDESPPHACDYWSYGVIMYELICGVPLSHYHRSVFTSHTLLHLPDALTVEEQSLLTQLLTYSPSSRLGAGPGGVEEIKSHPYFKQIDWAHVYDSWQWPGPGPSHGTLDHTRL